GRGALEVHHHVRGAGLNPRPARDLAGSVEGLAADLRPARAALVGDDAARAVPRDAHVLRRHLRVGGDDEITRELSADRRDAAGLDDALLVRHRPEAHLEDRPSRAHQTLASPPFGSSQTFTSGAALAAAD